MIDNNDFYHLVLQLYQFQWHSLKYIPYLHALQNEIMPVDPDNDQSLLYLQVKS